MSRNPSSVPSAWDDDWSAIADKQESVPPAPPPPAPEPKLTRAERKAKHAEANKQLWDSADTTPEVPIFIQARTSSNAVPATYQAPPIKPAVKVLSRRPPPKNATTTTASIKGASTNGVNGPNAQIDDEDEDSEAEEARKAAVEFKQRQARAAKEREEKQRKYAEVRERLFGTSSNVGSGDVTNGLSTAASATSGRNSPSRPGSSGRSGSRGVGNSGRLRGNGGNARGIGAGGNGGGSPARGRASKELFDPDYTPKPKSLSVRGGPSATTDERPIREPKGPDASGSSGFGNRGGRVGVVGRGTAATSTT